MPREGRGSWLVFEREKGGLCSGTHFRDCHSVLPDISMLTISCHIYISVAVQSTEPLADTGHACEPIIQMLGRGKNSVTDGAEYHETQIA
jgi:hypothetical protein